MSNGLGIYIHVPFCVRKCAYCDFYSAPGTADVMDAYTDALIAHIRASAPLGADLCADSVYFGGGTPSYLGAKNLVRILRAVRESFALTPDAEITLEANPGDLCLRAADGGALLLPLAILRAAGFDRLSLGVQSTDEGELSLLGRRHSREDAFRAVTAARAVGFSNITLDLMYGLPGQTMARWEQSVRDVLALEPEHVSCYALTLSPRVPLYKRLDELPDDEACLAFYLRAIELLAEAGLSQYEISNFARPGRQSRHNAKYWTLAPYLGFGPSAHSYMRGERWAWADDTAAYIRGEIREKERVLLSARDRAEEKLMLSLRTARGLDPAELPEPLRAPAAAVLDRYRPHGLVREEDGRRVLTPRGMFVSNSILAELFAAIPDDL